VQDVIGAMCSTANNKCITSLMKRSHLVNFISLHYSFNPKHFRVVLIVGSESVVSLTQTLIWELLAQNLRTIEAVGQSSNASVWSLPN
jgi:predicted transglutaminase-like cysteine proteinase